MIRPLNLLLLASGGLALGAVGYWSADAWYERRLWKGDQADAAAIGAKLAGERDPEPAPPAAARSPSDGIAFDDAAQRLGLDFAYFDGAEGKFQIVETMGGGMAVFDFDGDGSLDLFLVNGCSIPADPKQRRHIGRLFQRGPRADAAAERSFVDATEPAGVAFSLYGQGAAAADFDNDGFDDLLVTGFNESRLFRNQGDGTFVDVSESSGVGAAARGRWCTSSVWVDLDGDGDLDLYVCTYADVDLANPLVCSRDGVRSHCLPRRYTPQKDLLFINLGNGVFRESAAACGAVDPDGRGLGVVAADLANHGRPDVFVANDTSEAYLFVNGGVDKAGLPKLKNRGLELGVAYTGGGGVMAGMGVACADFNRDNRLDLYLTDFFASHSTLFSNKGEPGFADESESSGLGPPSRSKLGFGAMFLDADLDGWPDLLVANGHVSDFTANGLPYRMRAQFFRNRDGKRFVEVGDGASPYFRQLRLGRGVAVGDFDDDGRPDAVVSNILDPVALLLNRTSKTGDWIGVELIGTRTNRNGANVKVAVVRKGVEQRYETISGGGYLSSSDRRLIIGLGSNQGPVDQLIVRWPSGVEQKIPTPVLNRYHRLVEPVK